MSPAKHDFFRARGWEEVARVKHDFAGWYATVFRRGSLVVVLTDELRATHYENIRETLEEFLAAHRMTQVDKPSSV